MTKVKETILDTANQFCLNGLAEDKEHEELFFKIIASELKKNKSITFYYSPCEGTGCDIFMSYGYKQLGYMNGGSTKGALFFNAMRYSSGFHFRVSEETKLYPDYVTEKLRLEKDQPEVQGFTKLLNKVKENLLNYNKECEKEERTHPLQEAVYYFNDISKYISGEEYSLGSLIKDLEKLDKTKYIMIEEGVYPSEFDSWRGSYNQLSLTYEKKKKCNVQTVLELARGVNEKTLTGYKGGEFIMDEFTPIHISNCGECYYKDLNGGSYNAKIIGIEKKGDNYIFKLRDDEEDNYMLKQSGEVEK